jgi:hypothetical protein
VFASVLVLLHQRDLEPGGYRLSLRDRILRLHWLKGVGRGEHLFRSTRFQVPADRSPLVLELRQDRPGAQVTLTIDFWELGKRQSSSS